MKKNVFFILILTTILFIGQLNAQTSGCNGNDCYWYVTSLGDVNSTDVNAPGISGTFRWAILNSNLNGGKTNYIYFATSGTIIINDLLPAIRSKVIIDGSTAPNYLPFPNDPNVVLKFLGNLQFTYQNSPAFTSANSIIRAIYFDFSLVTNVAWKLVFSSPNNLLENCVFTNLLNHANILIISNDNLIRNNRFVGTDNSQSLSHISILPSPSPPTHGNVIVGNYFSNTTNAIRIQVDVTNPQNFNIVKINQNLFSNNKKNIDYSNIVKPTITYVDQNSIRGTSIPCGIIEVFLTTLTGIDAVSFVGTAFSDSNGNWTLNHTNTYGQFFIATATTNSSTNSSCPNTNTYGDYNTSTFSLPSNSVTCIAQIIGVPGNSTVCDNSTAITLNANPSGGSFSGPGISGNTFNPSNSGGVGKKTISYTFTCNGQNVSTLFDITVTKDYFNFPNISHTSTNYLSLNSTATSIQWVLKSYTAPVNCQVTIEAYTSLVDASGYKKPNWDLAFTYSLGNFVPANQSQSATVANLAVIQSLMDKDYFYRIKIQEVAQPTKVYYSDFQQFTLKGTQTSSSPAFPSTILATDQINYNYEVSYLDGGKTNESIVYSDGLGNPRQVQTKLNTENKFMCVETAYSEEGGGTVQSLPAPTDQTQFAYAKNFFDINDAGTLRDFTTEHFDKQISQTDGTLISPTALASTSSASAYYSTANTDQYVDDALGYPYSYNVWMANPLGKVQLGSGAGETFRYKQDGTGKNTTYAYAGVASEDLKRIFGKTDADKLKNVSAITSVDPNGVANFTYQDKEGKVLATAMNACAVTSMSPLDGENMDGFPIAYNILENDAIDMGSLEKTTSKSFNISCANTSVDFNYAFDSKTMPTQGTISCIFCQYDIDLKIIENATGIPVYTNTFSVPADNSTPSSCTSSSSQNKNSTISIQRPGSYTAIRTIRPKFDPTTGRNVIDNEFERFKSEIQTAAGYNLASYNALVAPDVKEEWFLLRKKKTANGAQPKSQSEWNEYLGCITNPTGTNCSNWIKTDWYADNFNLIDNPNPFLYVNCIPSNLMYGNFSGSNGAPNTGTSFAELIGQMNFWAPSISNSCSIRGQYYQIGFVINVPESGIYTFRFNSNASNNQFFTYKNGVFTWGIGWGSGPLNNFLYQVYLQKGLTSIEQDIALEPARCGSVVATLEIKGPSETSFSDISTAVPRCAPGSIEYPFGKEINNLDGKLVRSGDEGYVIADLVSPIQSSDLLKNNFIAAFNKQNYKNITTSNIIEMNTYTLDRGLFYDLNNQNSTTELKYLQDDMSLVSRSGTDPNEYYFLKVKYNTGGCEQECYVKTASGIALSSCPGMCSEQLVSYQQDLNLKSDDITAFSNAYTYTIQNPLCPFNTTCATSAYTVAQLQNIYSTPANQTIFKRNWAKIFDVMKLNEANQASLPATGSVLLERWIAATDRYATFNYNTCLASCSTATNGAGDICEVVGPMFKVCVLENIKRIGIGFDYLSNKSLNSSTPAFGSAGGLFPFVIDNTIPNRNDRIAISADDRASLGEPLFNFIMKYFDSTDPLYNIKSWSFWSSGSPSISLIPIGYGFGNCTETYNYDLSNFTPGLISVLNNADISCQDDFRKNVQFQTNGDSYIIDEYKNNCIDASTASCQSITDATARAACVANGVSTCTTINTAENLRISVIKKTLIEAYSNPDDFEAKYLALQNRDGGAYWLWLKGAVNNNYSPSSLPTIASLIQFMMNYGATAIALANCENRNKQAYEDWKKAEVMNYKTQLVQNYLNSCYGSMNESFKITYSVAKYHYTLYKYDAAGRLIQTVPPHGVDLVDVSPTSADPNRTPVHRMASTYSYNSFGQVVSNTTPDGGTTNFAYDNVGRVRFSESPEQKVAIACSYIRYDISGRIVESGELANTALSTAIPSVEDITYPSSGTKNDRVDYFYNSPKSGLPTNLNFTQTFTDGRISYTENANVATYYSYDVYGRVNSLLHEFKALGTTEKYKKINYEYQIISGIVTKVIYQQGVTGEEFSHKYSYDADNRLIKVEVSKDGVTWASAAGYTYYTHGPLKTLALGDQLQRINYTYNLQGWLKAINHPKAELDPGQDGLVGSSSPYAKDVFAMILNYYSGDYTRTGIIPGTALDISLSKNAQTDTYMPITASNAANSGNSGLSLYNGNISGILSSTAFDQTHSMGYVNPILSQRFRYDFLNRLKGSFAETRANLTTSPAWNPITTGASNYQELLSYDANGNINSLKRSGSSQIYFDNLTYNYTNDANGFRLNNKLNYLTDAGGGSGGNDLATQGSSNYAYDLKGRLVRDLSENIGTANGSGIAWTSFDKIKTITRSAIGKSNLNFAYDPMGRRASKKVMDPANAAVELFTEYYVYDASGNTIATYKKPNAQALALQEYYMYGSSRLGTYEGITTSMEKNKLSFEITDHLGNVRAVVAGDPIVDASLTSGQLAYDGFSSTPQNLTGSGGGTGWSTNVWAEDNTIIPASYTISTNSVGAFSYTNISPTVGRAESTGGGGVIGRAINASPGGPFNVSHSVAGSAAVWIHDHTDGIGMITNATRSTWLSFLIRKNNTVIGDEASVSLTSDASPTAKNNIAVSVGYFGPLSTTNSIQYWSILVGNVVYKSSVPVGPITSGIGQTCFVVVEIAPGKVNAYFNPTVDATGVITSPVSVSAVSSATLVYKNVVYYGGASVGHSAVDEIKIGESMPNVTSFFNSNSKYEKLLLHEPFDYTNAADLNGQVGGGSGTTANWNGAWGKSSLVSVATVATSLPYGDLQINGGSATASTYAKKVGRQVDLTATSPFLNIMNAGLVGKAGTSVWSAIVMQINTDGYEENSMSYGTGASAYTVGTNAVAVGYFGLASHDAAGNRFWSLKVGSTVYLSNIPIVKNVPTLLVTKTDFITNASIAKLYVNPTVFSEASPPNATSVATTLDLSFKNVVYQGNNGAMDEVLLGLNYSAVWGVRGKRAKILALTDYYPFGMDMSGRKFVADNYKYGFNGKEKDVETNDYDFGARMYNPAIGRNLSQDPLNYVAYPSLSPYNGLGNNPINNIDIDGALIIFVNGLYPGHDGDSFLKLEDYWGLEMLMNATATYHDQQAMFFNGSDIYNSWTSRRYDIGNATAKVFAMKIKNALDNQRSGENPDAKLNFISHSMGGAFAAGMIDFLSSATYPDDHPKSGENIFSANDFGDAVFFAPYQYTGIPGVNEVPIRAPSATFNYQYSHSDDATAGTVRMDNLFDGNYHITSANVGFGFITQFTEPHNIKTFESEFKAKGNRKPKNVGGSKGKPQPTKTNSRGNKITKGKKPQNINYKSVKKNGKVGRG